MRKFLRLLILSFLTCVLAYGQQQATSENDLKNQAEKSFASEDYESALSPYSQLLSLYPRNSSYNYCYGVSLLKAGKNKANAVSYLEVAAKDISNPDEVWIFLGQSYMVIGKFEDALGCFRKFESKVNAAKLKIFNSEELMANCRNAIELLKSRKSIAIVSSKEVAQNEFYKFYDWSLANGKMVPTAEQFLTSRDKDNQLNPVMFITNDKQTIYFASYGRRGENGKDIYVVRKMPNGQWSTPENLGETINSQANEDFPYIDRDGRTLYFSSKSKKSIGGYDIFKSKYDWNTGKWSTPENLGWPINTIGDDYLYVPISKGAEAFYSTTISSSKKEIQIRRIQLPNQDEALVTIFGYYAPTDQKIRRDARITVLQEGGGIITSVYTDPLTGKYELTLEPGKDYVLVVEGGGYLPHSESFHLPSNLVSVDLKQIVKITRDESNENLTLENYFYPASAIRDIPSEVKSASYNSKVDSSLMMSLQINNEIVLVTKPGSGKEEVIEKNGDIAEKNLVTIEKKDEYDPTLEQGPSLEEIRQKKEEEMRAAEIVEDKKSDNYDVTIGNEELASIAILDAKTSRAEADSLKLEVVRLNSGAIERDSLSIQLFSKAETSSEKDKTNYLNQAYVLKTDADNMRRQAADLQIAVIAKDSEAKTSEQEANALLATIDDGKGKKNDKENTNVVVAKEKTEPIAIAQNNSKTAKDNSRTDEIKELSPSETPVSAPSENKLLTDTISEQIALNENVNNKNKIESKSDEVVDEKSNTPTSTQAIVQKSTPEQNLSNKSDVENKSEQTINSENVNSVEAQPKHENLSNDSVTFVENTDSVSHEKSTDFKSEEISLGNNVNENINTKPSENNIIHDDVKTNDETLVSKEGKQESIIAHSNSQNQSPKDSLNIVLVDTSSKSKATISEIENEENKVTTTSSETTVVKEKISESESNPIQNVASGISEPGDTLSKSNDVALNESNVGANDPVIKSESDETITSKNEEPLIKYDSIDSTIDAPSNATINSELQVSEKDSISKSQVVITNKKELPLEKSNSSAVVKPTEKQIEIEDNSKLAQNTPEIKGNTAGQSDLATTPNSDMPLEPNAIKNNSPSNVVHPAEQTIENKNTENKITVELKPPFITPVEEKKPFPSNINSMQINPVSEEGRIAYQAYRSKYKNSKQLSDQSVELQNRISLTQPSEEKDSLISIANVLSDQASLMYDEAQIQLSAAQVIDPEVKNKMELNEQIVAYNSSMPLGNSESNSPTLNEPVKDTSSQTVSSEYPGSESKEIVSNANEIAGDKVEEKLSETANSEVSPSENYELTSEEKEEVEKATTFEVETPNGKEIVKIDTVGINTKNPEFKKYVEINKVITGKQVETIDVFAEAINQNKLSVEQKQEQNRLMDQAEVEQDRPTKAQIFIQADAKRDSSKLNEKEAAEKFAIAQSKANEVKTKTAEMQEIRQRIAIPGRKLPQQATKSTVKPDGLTTEEVLAMTSPEVDKPVVQNSNAVSVNESTSNAIPSSDFSPEKVEQFSKESFSIANAPVYNKENPIPMNPPIPDGLVFKVQIGAFRNEIPAEKFAGVQPITAETTRPEWIRYCVGLFQTFEPAVVVKKEMQSRGFKDAFVVAYLNGKRIELDEAYALIGKGKSTPDITYVQNSQNEMALLRANNIRPENISSIRNNVIDEDEKTFYGDNASNVKKSLAAIEYAVQVGVYKTQTTPKGLKTIAPLFTEKIRNSLYRFTTDHYFSYASADSMKRIARREGVKDAFIVVYRNGVQSALSSVPVAERTTRSIPDVRNVPSVVIPESTSSLTTAKSADSNVEDAKSLQSFPSAVTTGGKIIYRVQIGAFKNNIPFTAVVAFLNIADKGITQLTDERGLHIFYAGVLDNFSSASALRDEIVSKGVSDAFVVALQDGKRVVLTDEMKSN